jgi:polysaccharide biosynthesis transport protein
MNQTNAHPLDYLALLKRRLPWFAIPLAVCTASGIALALLLPPTYRSSATIAVQAPAVVLDLVPAWAALNRDERLRALSQQLRSHAVLERVAREEGLTASRPIEAVTQELLTHITVEVPKPIASTQGEPELNRFDIVYRDRTAEQTRRVTDRIARVFVDEHSRSRELQAEDTAEFLARQVRDSQQRLSTLEKELRAAKERYMGRLPEQTAINLQTLGGAQQQLDTTRNSLRSELDRLTLTERQMQSMKRLSASVPSTPSGASSPLQRVVTLEAQLEEARGKYTAKHPEVRRLEEELKAARADAGASASSSEKARQALIEADPAYQQLATESNLTRLRIEGLQRTEGQLLSQIARYQQRLDAAPMVEQAISSPQREYELEAENHKQLSEKLAAATVQEQIARSRGGERFSVLYGASLPDSPESPNRGRILLMALALGIFLGGGLAFARELLDQSILDAKTLQSEFNVPVLVEIPHLPDASRRTDSRAPTVPRRLTLGRTQKRA